MQCIFQYTLIINNKQTNTLFSQPFPSPVLLLCWLLCSCLHHPGCRNCERWKVSPAAQLSGRSSGPKSTERLEENNKRELSTSQSTLQISYASLICKRTLACWWPTKEIVTRCLLTIDGRERLFCRFISALNCDGTRFAIATVELFIHQASGIQAPCQQML